jgi:hypothetical protein
MTVPSMARRKSIIVFPHGSLTNNFYFKEFSVSTNTSYRTLILQKIKTMNRPIILLFASLSNSRLNLIRSSKFCGFQKKAKNGLVVKIDDKQKESLKLRTYTTVDSKFSSIVF